MKHIARKLALFAAGSAALALSACSNGIHDQVVGGNALLGEAKVGALSTTASYRTVVTRFDDKARVCPEPPPDVAVAITSSLLAQLEAGNGDINANATVAQSVAEKVAPLLKRTAALQFYRDARSYNCFAHMNGALTPAQYVTANNAVLNSTTLLMALEIIKGTSPDLPDEFEATLNDAITKKVQEQITQILSNTGNKPTGPATQ